MELVQRSKQRTLLPFGTKLRIQIGNTKRENWGRIDVVHFNPDQIDTKGEVKTEMEIQRKGVRNTIHLCENFLP
jgi:hypothetical protein